MSCDFKQLPHVGIQTLKPYIPGKSADELASEQGIKDIIKLASNENPLGCSPLARKALADMSGLTLATYPHPTLHPVQKKLSDKLGVNPDCITLCNGSDLMFWLLLTTFALHNKKHLLVHDFSFMSYRTQAQALGIPVRSVPLLKDWEVDIEAMIQACNSDTALLFIANPNNPTGVAIPLDKIKHLMKNIPDSTIVLIDEAYYEYAYPEDNAASLALLHKFPNLVVTRTFSKAYGLASLRLGYAIAHPHITELLLRVQPPFSVNQAAMDAACAALDDKAFITQSLSVNHQGMQQMRAGLQAMDLNQIPSVTNFISFDCGMDSLPIYNGLLRHGIIVRPLHAYNLPNYLRVSIGKPEHNERFLAKLTECLHNKRVQP